MRHSTTDQFAKGVLSSTSFFKLVHGRRVFAYYHLDCRYADRTRRHWWRYRVDHGRPVLNAVFPVAIVKH